MLPKLDVPIYSVNLISTGKPIRFRPFLVKEQKLFLMTAESADGNEMISTIRQVLKNCVLDEIDIDSLPTFDLEFLFMHLRARSVEEVVELNYKCNNRVKGEEGQEKTCSGVVNLKVNILEIEPTKNPKHEKKIQINNDLGIVFKYPTFEMFQKYEKMSESEVMINILVDCIDYIFDKEQVYYAKDTPKKELEDFVDNLQQKDLEKFKEFFDTMPEIKKDFHFKCPKCAYEEEITIKGMQSFFV
jgi:hypothetical protein